MNSSKGTLWARVMAWHARSPYRLTTLFSFKGFVLGVSFRFTANGVDGTEICRVPPAHMHKLSPHQRSRPRVGHLSQWMDLR